MKKEYEDQIAIIENSVEIQDFFIVVDGCTDNFGRFIAGVMVGILNPEIYSHPHLFELVELEKTDGATISQLVNTSISKLFEGDVPYEKFKLFLTDSASYMLSAGANSKGLYTEMLHVTCAAHGVQRFAEEIRENHDLVNQFIFLMKKTFVKCQRRKRLSLDGTPG